MVGGIIVKQSWQEFCRVWLRVGVINMSVLGSQVFGQASMESCDIWLIRDGERLGWMSADWEIVLLNTDSFLFLASLMVAWRKATDQGCEGWLEGALHCIVWSLSDIWWVIPHRWWQMVMNLNNLETTSSPQSSQLRSGTLSQTVKDILSLF